MIQQTRYYLFYSLSKPVAYVTCNGTWLLKVNSEMLCCVMIVDTRLQQRWGSGGLVRSLLPNSTPKDFFHFQVCSLHCLTPVTSLKDISQLHNKAAHCEKKNPSIWFIWKRQESSDVFWFPKVKNLETNALIWLSYSDV